MNIFSNDAGLRSPTLLRMNNFEGFFQEIWPQIMDQILYRNICLVEQPFFSKATNGYLWNFSFLDLFMHLVSNFTRKDTILSKLTEFGHQDSLRAVSILLYFISFRAWIENFHKQPYGNNAELFLQGQKGQDLKIFGKEGHFSNIANIQTTHVPFTNVFIRLRSGIPKSGE